MAFKLRSGRNLGAEIRHIAAEQVDRAIAEIEHGPADRTRTVHQVRKRCRRIRALMRLTRSCLDGAETYRRENVFFRDLARSLAGARDADVTVQTMDRVLTEYGTALNRAACEPVCMRILSDRRSSAARPANVEQGLAHAATQLRITRQRIGSWEVAAKSTDGLRRGLAKTYRDGRYAMAEAVKSASDEAMHEWRKQAKYHRDQIRLFEDAWPEIIVPWYGAMNELCEALGDERDLSMLNMALEGAVNGHDRTATDALRGVIRVRRDSLRDRAWTLGARLYGERPGSLARRVMAYWETAAR